MSQAISLPLWIWMHRNKQLHLVKILVCRLELVVMLLMQASEDQMMQFRSTFELTGCHSYNSVMDTGIRFGPGDGST